MKNQLAKVITIGALTVLLNAEIYHFGHLESFYQQELYAVPVQTQPLHLDAPPPHSHNEPQPLPSNPPSKIDAGGGRIVAGVGFAAGSSFVDGVSV